MALCKLKLGFKDVAVGDLIMEAKKIKQRFRKKGSKPFLQRLSYVQ